MKFVRASFLAFAMLIVLVHTFVPHHHYDESSVSIAHIQEHQKVDSFIDLLVIAFHHEQYDGQLEIYDLADYSDVSLNFHFLMAILPEVSEYILSSVEDEHRQINRFFFVEPTLQDVLANQIELRGPPNKLV